MKTYVGLALTTAAALTAFGCGHKKKSSTDTTTADGGVASGAIGAGQLFVISTLGSVPSADATLQGSGAGLALTTGTPPLFTAIAGDLTKYITGDVSTLVTSIRADQNSASWADLKTKVGSFFDAEAKCAVMEHSARIIQRLKEDTAPLCLLKLIDTGKIGSAIYTNDTGVAIADLNTVFAQDVDDKIIQIGKTDKGQPHYEMVKITGSTTSPSAYHLVYSTCGTVSKKAFRQNVVDVNNTTGLLTFTSAKNGALDDMGVKPSATFSLTASLVSDGAGGVEIDVSKPSTITYAGAGAMGQLNATQQGSLTISSSDLLASFFESDSGHDNAQNAISTTDKSALKVQFSGSGTADLILYQGAGRRVTTMSGTGQGGVAISNSNDHAVGFDFDDTQVPQFANAPTSAYLTALAAAVDFSTDAVLSQTAPTAPDMTTIDDTACTATPTTGLSYIAKPEDNTVFNDANTACNSFPAANSANMCDPLRNLDHDVNNAMHADRAANGADRSY